jgi:uncharacterized membrane protein
MNDMGNQGGGGVAVDPQDASANKVMALLSYFGIFLVIPYLMKRDSPFVKYHLNQGIILFVVGFGASIVTSILAGILASVLGNVGGMVGSLLSLVVSLGSLVLFIIGAMNAWGGKAKPLPVVGGLFTVLK